MFLDQSPGFSRSALEPLWILQLALGDLEAGKQADMLKPSKKNGPPGLTSNTQTIMGFAVVGLDMLIRFRGLSRDDAAKRIAKILNDAGFKMPDRSKRKMMPDVIKDWHYRMETTRQGEWAPFATQHWQQYSSMITKDSPDHDVEGWLEEIKQVAGARAV